MIKTRISVVFLVITLFLQMIGCNVNDVPDETSGQISDRYAPEIKLTIPGQIIDENSSEYNYINNPWIDAYNDELGIVITPEWDAGRANTISLSEQLAAGVVPDLMPALGRLEFEFIFRLGLAADLTDLLDQYASDLTKDILNSDDGYSLQSSTIDGNIYALPHVYGNTDNIPLMWIRTDWLEKLNLNVPRTAEELVEVLDAFVNLDPNETGQNDTYGLIGTGSLWEFGALFNIFGAQPFWSWYYDDDNRLRYSTVSFVPQMKTALTYMQRLYRQGLIYPEFGLLPVDRYYKMFADGKAGVAFEYKYFPTHIINNTPDNLVTAEWQAFTLPVGKASGQPTRPFSYHGPAAYNVVSTRCESPEAAIKMLNLYVDKVYSEERDKYYDLFVKTPEGVAVQDMAIIQTYIANDLTEYERVALALQNNDPTGLKRAEMEKYNQCKLYLAGDLTQWAEYQYYRPDNATVTAIKYYVNEVTPFFSDYYGDEPISARQYFPMLNNLWLDTCTRIIMGSDDVSTYDNFVRDWYALGGAEAEEEINQMIEGRST